MSENHGEDLMEDEISIEEHVSWMKKEVKRLKKDTAGIGLRMEKTYHDRMKYIQTHSILEVVEKYPCLQDSVQVKFYSVYPICLCLLSVCSCLLYVCYLLLLLVCFLLSAVCRQQTDKQHTVSALCHPTDVCFLLKKRFIVKLFLNFKQQIIFFLKIFKANC